MQEADGVMLHACGKDEIEKYRSLAKQILGEARKAYMGAKMINSNITNTDASLRRRKTLDHRLAANTF